ncbi:glycosyltransferase family 2 protein [Brachybacterium sp. AOP24-D1-21]|uniref:glycosyltransferase family 2 protein n=1 Tax=Brachybacterium sp. AOP24-D1-21 TaxID=3457711 RepID=UPI0040349664
MNAQVYNEASVPLVSVIIGFKDWGLERLELSVRSIHDSLSEIDHEVVISDYGSEDTASIAESAQRVGARHVIVETDGEWSRSRALNAGVRASGGEIVLATDADMLFTPRALSRAVEQIQRHPHEIVILQCRDLPVGYSHEVVRREGFDWDRFASIGQIRPRWGMGGLVAVHREIWERLRGWDERMHTYGGEDVDFGKRAQAAGSRIDWLDEPGVGMYHIWHPSSGASATRSIAATAAIAANRRIHSTDATFARNRVRPRYLPSDMVPLVSVLVDARFTGAESLETTITSILGQSVHDLEVLVVGEAELVDDPRVLHSSTDEVSVRGTFVTSARAGEVWAEDRLEILLDLWTPGTGLISDCTAQLLRDENGTALAPLSVVQTSTGDPRTTLLRSALLPASLCASAQRWGDAVRAVAASGAGWVVAAASRHVTIIDLADDEPVAAERAADALALDSALARCGLTPPDLPATTVTALGVLANALLYGRALTLEIVAPSAIDLAPYHDLFADDRGWIRRTVRTREGTILERDVRWTGDDPAFVVEATRRLAGSGAAVHWRYATDADYELPGTASAASLVHSAESVYGTPEKPATWLAISEDQGFDDALSEALSKAPSVTVVLDRVAEADGAETSWMLARFRNGNVAEALALAASLPTPTAIEVIELSARVQGTEVSR